MKFQLLQCLWEVLVSVVSEFERAVPYDERFQSRARCLDLAQSPDCEGFRLIGIPSLITSFIKDAGMAGFIDDGDNVEPRYFQFSQVRTEIWVDQSQLACQLTQLLHGTRTNQIHLRKHTTSKS